MILRSLLVANSGTVVGGGEVGLLMLAEGLVARGHRPLIAVPCGGGLADHLERVEIGPGREAILADLRRLAVERDVVHVYSSAAMAAVVESGIATPLVYHALVPNRDPRDQVDAQHADVVIANSMATAARFGGPSRVGEAGTSSRVVVVYNGVGEPRRVGATLGLDPSRRTIAIMGATVARKGQLDALPGLLEVVAATEDVDVVFIGRVGGPAAVRLRRLARASAGRLRLMGFVPGVADHFGEFALVLVPSRSEGFGRVAVEALRAGVPILATRVDGLVEALAGLRDPWLPDDRAAWGRRMLQELDAPTHSEAELRSAAHRFDPDRFVAEIEAIHIDLVRSGGRGR